jgi:SseB protein C-terminal domain/SseB protein N-terminal domain
MLPIDPADGPGGGVVPAQPLPPPAVALPNPPALPAQAMAYGGTFVRPGALAWGGTKDAPDGAYSSCEAVEQVLATVVKDPDRMEDLLDELSHARLWVPLPAGQRPVTDGSAVALPTVTYLGTEFVPCFTSIQRLASWVRSAPAGQPQGGADALDGAPTGAAPGQQVPESAEGQNAGQYPLGEYQFSDVERPWQRAGDARVAPHIVVPAAALARHLPTGLGLALNPGAEASVPIYPEGVADLAALHASASGVPIRVGHPPAEPEALLREVGSGLHALPTVRQAARAWLSVPGQGEGLIISVTLDDPASEPAHEAVVVTIERAVAAVPLQAQFPIDVTFPGETEPDLVDEWVAENTVPFYTRG